MARNAAGPRRALPAPLMNAHAICFVNAGPLSAASSLRVVGDRIAAIDTLPAGGYRVSDRRGERLLPELIHAHDHLQFNNFPRTRVRAVHQNVGEWVADIT